MALLMCSFLSIVFGNNPDRLRKLNARAFAQAAADAFVRYMGLLQQSNSYSDILQGTGSVAHAAGLPLERQTKLLVDNGAAHTNAFNNGVCRALNLLNGTTRADVATFHAQDAALIAWRDVGRID